MRSIKLLSLIGLLFALGFASVAARDLSTPTFLFTSGSARLLGMGDASVALVDPTGYNTNPGTLALAFEDRTLIVSFKPRHVDGSYSSFASYFLAVGNQPLFRKTSRWRFALSLVNQFAAGQSYYYSGVSPYSDQWLGGDTYSLADLRKESIRAITVGATRKGSFQLGLGTTARNVRLDGSRIQYPHPSGGPINGWNFDVGAIVRWSLTVVEAPSSTRGKTVTIVPGIGLSCTNLLRTHVRGINFVTYPPITTDGLESIESDRQEYLISSRTMRSGASVSIAVSDSRLDIVGLIGAYEYQIGSHVEHGSKIGTELSLFESAAVRYGTGVVGTYNNVHSWGVSISTAGLQKMLFRESVHAGGALSNKHFLRRLNFSLSYAATSTLTRTDLPDNYWTISVGL